ncbi:MAG: type II toxin-antitoxin system VapC family toxin [Dehalococcoidia bacterium]
MPVCVDANIIIGWLVPQQQRPAVYPLVDGWLEEGTEMVGPSLLYSEVVSVLRQQVTRGVLDAADAFRLLSVFFRLGIRRIDRTTVYSRAYELATRFNHPRAYDAHYLAAAEQAGCPLWTADRPFYESVHQHLSWVNLVQGPNP